MGTSTLEMYLEGFTTAKHRPTLIPSDSTAGRIRNRNECCVH